MFHPGLDVADADAAGASSGWEVGMNGCGTKGTGFIDRFAAAKAEATYLTRAANRPGP